MSKNSLSKQTAKFLARVAENVPELSGYGMQYFIEHPAELAKRLLVLQPSLTQFMEEQRVFGKMKLIRLHPTWDFMFLQSSDYPEVGIAVSDRSGSCGAGWRLLFSNDNGEQETFVAPCGCCDFSNQLGETRDHPVGAQLITDICKTNGIKFPLFHCWSSFFRKRTAEDQIQYIDPYNNDKRMRLLDLPRFQNAFGNLAVETSRHSSPGSVHVLTMAEFLDDQKE